MLNDIEFEEIPIWIEFWKMNFEGSCNRVQVYGHIIMGLVSIPPTHQIRHDFWRTEFPISSQAIRAALNKTLVCIH
jgi:hypothetical protein